MRTIDHTKKLFLNLNRDMVRFNELKDQFSFHIHSLKLFSLFDLSLFCKNSKWVKDLKSDS